MSNECKARKHAGAREQPLKKHPSEINMKRLKCGKGDESGGDIGYVVVERKHENRIVVGKLTGAESWY